MAMTDAEYNRRVADLEEALARAESHCKRAEQIARDAKAEIQNIRRDERKACRRIVEGYVCDECSSGREDSCESGACVVVREIVSYMEPNPPRCAFCGLAESVHADAGGSRGLDGCAGFSAE